MRQSILKNTIFSNARWLMGGRIAQMGIQLLVSLLTARYLGPSNYGLLSYAAAYTGFFFSLCTLGIQSVLVKEFLDHPGEEGEILGTSLALRAGASVLSGAVILCIVFVADKGDPTVLAVVGLSAAAMVFRIFEVFYCWFQSRLQSKVTALISLGAYLLAAAYKGMLLILGKPVTRFAFAAVLEQACIAGLFLLSYRRYGGSKLAVSLDRAREILRKSCHFILPGLMIAVYAQTDRIMLKQLISETELAYYSAAMSVSGVWCFVLSALIDSFYPEITRAYREDRARFCRRNRQMYALVFYLSLAVSVVICCLAEPGVRILYGEQYLGAVAPLRILTWNTGFSYLGVARNAWIVCENRQKKLIWVSLTAAAANVLLNLLLIPSWGAAGAAAASLMAQMVTTLIAPLFLRELRENAKLMLQAIVLRGIWEGDRK